MLSLFLLLLLLLLTMMMFRPSQDHQNQCRRHRCRRGGECGIRRRCMKMRMHDNCLTFCCFSLPNGSAHTLQICRT